MWLSKHQKLNAFAVVGVGADSMEVRTHVRVGYLVESCDCRSVKSPVLLHPPHPPIHPSTPSIHLSIHQSIHPSINPSTHPFALLLTTTTTTTTTPYLCKQAFTGVVATAGVGSLAPRTIAVPFGSNTADDAHGLHTLISGMSVLEKGEGA